MRIFIAAYDDKGDDRVGKDENEGYYCLLIAILCNLDVAEAQKMYKYGPDHPLCKKLLKKEIESTRIGKAGQKTDRTFDARISSITSNGMVHEFPYLLFSGGFDCTTETSKPLEKAQIISPCFFKWAFSSAGQSVPDHLLNGFQDQAIFCGCLSYEE